MNKWVEPNTLPEHFILSGISPIRVAFSNYYRFEIDFDYEKITVESNIYREVYWAIRLNTAQILFK